MSTNRDVEGEEGNISYPSPGAETMEVGPFYNTNGREGVPEQHDHHEHQDHQEHPDQHMSEQVPVQVHDQGEMPPQEPETPQQHMSRPANLEELQLAAQLGQGLTGAPILPTTDPNMNVEDPNLRSIMPHPEPEQHQTPSYVQDTPTSDPMGQHSMPVPVGAPMPPQYSLGDNIPPRKRSKVSRACDECRRKKIKCDAQSDTGETPCSSCARSSIRCLFSRVPQKRGPSKGYIKELADRIHSIENKLESDGALSQDDLDRLFVQDRPRAQSNEESNRKRPFSSISTGEFSTPGTSRQTPWGSEHRPIQPSAPTMDAYGGNYTTSTLAPQPSPLKPDSTPSKPPVATMEISMPDIDELPDIDEGALHSYLSNVQPVYPILPSNTIRVQALLAQAPPTLRIAFANALTVVGGGSGGDVKLANSLLNEWEISEAPTSQASQIVYAQTLLMLLIDADWRNSKIFSFLWGRAVAVASLMELWRYTPIETESEPDSDDQLCVRIWWSLILMDRWHAAGSGKPSFIPDNCVVSPPGLENMLGEVCFYLTRLAKFLNRVSFVVLQLQPGASTTEPAMAAILTDYIENYREDLPAHIEVASYPLVHLAYWHCRLLVALLSPSETPAEILWPLRELMNLLFINPHIRSPLVNHFASLASMALKKLMKLEGARDDASQLIKDILDKPAGIWDRVKDKLAEQMRPTSSVEAAASQGLQHLADLATAHEGIAPGADEIAFGPSLASGYLDIA
ncbi:Fc.00g038380.m01.CDS01 [Cosmosporella sp. VM-42]